MSMLPNPVMPFVDFEREGVKHFKQSWQSDLPSLTQQQFLEESDINNIIARYRDTNMVYSSAREPMYGDFTNLPSYQEALDIVNRGADIFMSLPSKVRGEFDNDPSKFLEYANDPAHKEDLVKWGLVPRDAPKVASLDDVVSELKAGRPSEPPKEA